MTSALLGRDGVERGTIHLISDMGIMFTNCRCSPEDHAILEAEYKKNPKPDKAARVEIVNRVALGEKEVQVSAFEIQDF